MPRQSNPINPYLLQLLKAMIIKKSKGDHCRLFTHNDRIRLSHRINVAEETLISIFKTGTSAPYSLDENTLDELVKCLEDDDCVDWNAFQIRESSEWIQDLPLKSYYSLLNGHRQQIDQAIATRLGGATKMIRKKSLTKSFEEKTHTVIVTFPNIGLEELPGLIARLTQINQGKEINIRDVEEGSIILTFDMESKGYQELVRLYKEDKLSKFLGHKVSVIQEIRENEVFGVERPSNVSSAKSSTNQSVMATNSYEVLRDLSGQLVSDRCITEYGSMALYQIGKNKLPKFSQFVFEMYAYHYFKKYQWYPTVHDLYRMQHSDEEQFGQSVYFAYKSSDQQILGTIKATRKVEDISFPIEYEFNVDLQQVIEEKKLMVNEIWHLGRLAIDANTIRTQKLPITSRQMLRYLLMHSLSVINQHPDNLMIAESDVLIYEIFHDLGINMQIVGELRHCLGSPTYPVIVTGEDITQWIKQNPIQEI